MTKEGQPVPESHSFLWKAKRKALIAARVGLAGVAVAGFGTSAWEHYYNIHRINDQASKQATLAGQPAVPEQQLRDARETVTTFTREVQEDLDSRRFTELQQAVNAAAADATTAQQSLDQQAAHNQLKNQIANEQGRRRENCIEAEGLVIGSLATVVYAIGPFRRFKKVFSRSNSNLKSL